MADLTNAQRTALTRLGAQARLAELTAESDAILKAFPDLRGQKTNGHARKTPAAMPKARKRYRMSAANRKAAAERMRAFWAAKRATKKPPVASADEKPDAKARSNARRRASKAR